MFSCFLTGIHSTAHRSKRFGWLTCHVQRVFINLYSTIVPEFSTSFWQKKIRCVVGTRSCQRQLKIHTSEHRKSVLADALLLYPTTVNRSHGSQAFSKSRKTRTKSSAMIIQVMHATRSSRPIRSPPPVMTVTLSSVSWVGRFLQSKHSR